MRFDIDFCTVSTGPSACVVFLLITFLTLIRVLILLGLVLQRVVHNIMLSSSSLLHILYRIFIKRKSIPVSSETKNCISFLGILLIESLADRKAAYSTVILSVTFKNDLDNCGGNKNTQKSLQK